MYVSGLSVDSIIDDAGSSIFDKGQMYVALSRVRKLTGLHLAALDVSSIMVSTRVLSEYNKLRLRALNTDPLDNLDVGIRPIPQVCYTPCSYYFHYGVFVTVAGASL